MISYCRLGPFLFVFALFSAGCAEERASQRTDASSEATVELGDVQQTSAAAAPAPNASATAIADRKLIKRATLRFRVNDYAAARAAVAREIRQFGAYLAGEDEARRAGRIENTVTARVPTERFEDLLEALTEIAARIDTRDMQVDDVTEEFVDLEARLRARRAVEDRYVALLGEANSVEDILRVEEELRQIREEIERAQGQLEYLKDRVALSTITLTFYQTTDLPATASGPSFFEQAGGAFMSGWHGLQRLLLLGINLWPLLLLALAAVAAVQLYRRRRLAQASP